MARRDASPRLCFFAPVRDRALLDRVEFYRQDLDILRGLTDDLVIATRWREIPWHCDLYVVWWWTWAFLPVVKALAARRPVAILGVFDYRWPFEGQDYLRRPWWQRGLMRFALRRADANAFSSGLERDQVATELRAPHALHVPLAVDTDFYAPGGARDPSLVATVAWMNEGNAQRKCLPQIVEAMPRVLARHPQTRFVLAGEQGSAFGALRARVHALGVEKAVEFPGVVTRAAKRDLMRTCGVYLQPSLYEGFGLAILEAMACGAAVVGSPVGAVPEVVGDAALLVDGTSPAAIADGVGRLLEDPPLRESLGQRASARAAASFGLAGRERAIRRMVAALLRGEPADAGA